LHNPKESYVFFHIHFKTKLQELAALFAKPIAAAKQETGIYINKERRRPGKPSMRRCQFLGARKPNSDL
jgi:hypothetical protein